MSHDLTRRALLSASPALLPPVALATCGTEVLSATDPHPALWAEWQRLRDHYNTVTMDEAEERAVWTRYEETADLLRTTVATTPEGLRAQFEFMAEDLMEQGTACSLHTTWSVPFLDAFRAGLREL